jgi:hypothetical protein
MAEPIQHLVLFRLPGSPDPGLEEEMRQQIRRWVGAIPGLRRVRFGRETGGRADGYQFGLLTEFSDSAALEAYLTHPLHVTFLEWVQSHPFEVLRFDYPLNERTSLLEQPAP